MRRDILVIVLLIMSLVALYGGGVMDRALASNTIGHVYNTTISSPLFSPP